MATIMKPISVKEMLPYKKDYEVTVRVLRKWIRESDEKDAKKRKLYGMELICIDSEGDLIQATVPKTLVRIFNPQTQEGKIYKISKFVTEQNLGNDRATFHKCRIAMHFTTKVQEVHAQDIPSQAVRFVSIEDIIHGNVTNEYYIDVIGLLTQLHETEVKNGYKKRLIDIIDEQKRRLRLTVWEAYFPEVDRINEACKSLEEKPVLVLKCVQRKEWYGTVTISTVRGATKFEINPDIPEVHAFKNRMKEISNDAISGPVGDSSSQASTILAGAKIKSLASILETTKAGYYVTLVYIEEMNMSIHWYFNSCGKCLGRVSQEGDNLWYCKKRDCKVSNIGMPKADQRFQMKVEANDGGHVKAQLMLWDAPISNIIGKKASTILEEQEREGDREAVPLEFRELMEREFIAKIYVDQEYNIQQKSMCFKATQLCGDRDMIKKWRELEAITKDSEGTQSSALTISGSEITTSELMLLENIKTYSEEEKDNTPISKLPQKRSSLECDGCEITEVRQSTTDQGSSSKATKAIKNIKIEK